MSVVGSRPVFVVASVSGTVSAASMSVVIMSAKVSVPCVMALVEVEVCCVVSWL